MNFSRIFEEIEKLVLGLFLLRYLLPKTVLRVIATPWWIPAYVDSQTRNDAADRYVDYIPPFAFWFILAVCPFAAIVYLFGALGLGSYRPILGDIYAQHVLVVLPVVSILFAFGPASCARLMQRRRREPIDRQTFTRAFAIQCYALAPATTLALPLLAVMLMTTNPSGHQSFVRIWLWLLIAYMTYVEGALAWVELRGKKWRVIDTLDVSFSAAVIWAIPLVIGFSIVSLPAGKQTEATKDVVAVQATNNNAQHYGH
jgi:hypothetical protein